VASRNSEVSYKFQITTLQFYTLVGQLAFNLQKEGGCERLRRNSE